jgi:hypothetical protein
MSGDLENTPVRFRFDSVSVRCVLALVLAGVSLVLVLLELELSLVPLVAALGLITQGARIKNRHEPPIKFLVVVPIIVAIVVTLVRHGT